MNTRFLEIEHLGEESALESKVVFLKVPLLVDRKKLLKNLLVEADEAGSRRAAERVDGEALQSRSLEAAEHDVHRRQESVRPCFEVVKERLSRPRSDGNVYAKDVSEEGDRCPVFVGESVLTGPRGGADVDGNLFDAPSAFIPLVFGEGGVLCVVKAKSGVAVFQDSRKEVLPYICFCNSGCVSTSKEKDLSQPRSVNRLKGWQTRRNFGKDRIECSRPSPPSSDAVSHGMVRL